MTLREVLDPYLPLLIIIITLFVNYHLFKRGVRWYGIVGVNLILVTIAGLLGLEAYEFLPKLTAEIFDLIKTIWKETIGSIFGRGSNDETTTSFINTIFDIKI